VTTSTFDNLVVRQTPTGSQISGFVTGETQARLVFTRRGEQMEIVCMTEALACAQLAAIDALSSWQLVSARLEPYRRGAGLHADEGEDGAGADDEAADGLADGAADTRADAEVDAALVP
jgi:hypothetical protein